MNKAQFLISLFFVVLLFGITSCGERPSYVLSEKKMVSLMADMELAEAYVNTQGSSSNDERVEIGRRVLEAHGVSEETLDTTLAWYGRNMDNYSELFEKVDAEIEKRRKKYTEIPNDVNKESDNLWPYMDHLIISDLTEEEGFSFSIPKPDIDKGYVLKFSFFLPNSTGIKGVLGVEYEDGYGEASIFNGSKNHIEISVQTDSAKSVHKIFGSLLLKDVKSKPVYIDSIALHNEVLDSLNYRSKRRSQKSFGVMLPQKQEKKIETSEQKDSVESGKELAEDKNHKVLRDEKTDEKPEEKPGVDKLRKKR